MISPNKKRDEATAHFFEELKDTFFFQIHRMQKAFFRHGNHLMQESGYDLQMEQLPVLMTVYAVKSLSQREIADITMRDKSSIQRSVTVLQRKGLLTIQQDEIDKRKNIVIISDAGIELVKKTKAIMRKAEEEAFSTFLSAERAQALKSMQDIADKLEKL